MGDCVREKTSKELIEESNLDNKDLICGKAAVGGNYNSTRDICKINHLN